MDSSARGPDRRAVISARDLGILQRAVELARRGRGSVEPNPLVGAVVAGSDGVVAEGWHALYGDAHAEVAALGQAGRRAAGATLYVTLEPCCRAGKTPACTDLILRSGVGRVVVGALDPHPEQQGRGLEILRQAGLEVICAEPASEAEDLVHRYHLALERNRPWTILKWAMSLDGKIARSKGRPSAITSSRARLRAHLLRGRVEAVLIGIETALADDPLLTCRAPGPARAQPLRVVLDTHARLPVTSRLVRTAREVPVLVICGTSAEKGRHEGLAALGVAVQAVSERPRQGLDLEAVLAHLWSRGVRRLLVEGGARMHGSFVREHLADQISVFIAPLLLGGADPVPAILTGPGSRPDEASALHLDDVQVQTLRPDLLLTGFLDPP